MAYQITKVGSIEGCDVYKRGDWYLILNASGSWSKLLFDHRAGEVLKETLDREISGLIESSEATTIEVRKGYSPPKSGGMEIEPL